MESKLPLGLMKQVCLKLDSVVSDLYEIKNDPDIDSDDRENFNTLADVAGRMEAAILNVVHKECDEEEFLREDISMDEIGEWPGNEESILDEIIS